MLVLLFQQPGTDLGQITRLLKAFARETGHQQFLLPSLSTNGKRPFTLNGPQLKKILRNLPTEGLAIACTSAAAPKRMAEPASRLLPIVPLHTPELAAGSALKKWSKDPEELPDFGVFLERLTASYQKAASWLRYPRALGVPLASIMVDPEEFLANVADRTGLECDLDKVAARISAKHPNWREKLQHSVCKITPPPTEIADAVRQIVVPTWLSRPSNKPAPRTFIVGYSKSRDRHRLTRKFWDMPDDEVKERVTLFGRDRLEKALSGGKGVILVNSHFRLARAVPRVLVAYGYKLTSIEARPFAVGGPPGLRVVTTLDNPGMRVAAEARRALGRNEIVHIAGDGTTGAVNHRFPFRGGSRSYPTGFATLTLLTGAEALPVFAAPEQEDRAVVDIQEALTPAPEDGTREEKVHELVRRYAAALDEKWRVSPPEPGEDNPHVGRTDEAEQDRLSRKWAKRWASDTFDAEWLVDTLPDAALRAVQTELAAGRRKVLDIGCGDGRLTRELAKLGCNVLGVDFAPAAVERAQRDNTGEGGPSFALLDVTKEPPGNGPYDLLFDRGCFHVLTPKAKSNYAKNMSSACEEGAALVMLHKHLRGAQEMLLTTVSEAMAPFFSIEASEELSMDRHADRDSEAAIHGTLIVLRRQPTKA